MANIQTTGLATTTCVTPVPATALKRRFATNFRPIKNFKSGRQLFGWKQVKQKCFHLAVAKRSVSQVTSITKLNQFQVVNILPEFTTDRITGQGKGEK